MEKSLNRKSPGAAVASARPRNASVLGSLCCVTMPPRTYSPNALVSSSSSKECGCGGHARQKR